MYVQTVNLHRRDADRPICARCVRSCITTGCFHSSAGSCVFLFYDCKNVIRVLSRGLIWRYQPLVVGMIIGAGGEGTKMEGKTGRYSRVLSIILLNPFILLEPLAPKQSHSHLSLLFLLSLITPRHCFKRVPFRCSRLSSCLAGWFINAPRRDPSLRDT